MTIEDLKNAMSRFDACEAIGWFVRAKTPSGHVVTMAGPYQTRILTDRDTKRLRELVNEMDALLTLDFDPEDGDDETLLDLIHEALRVYRQPETGAVH